MTIFETNFTRHSNSVFSNVSKSDRMLVNSVETFVEFYIKQLCPENMIQNSGRVSVNLYFPIVSLLATFVTFFQRNPTVTYSA